MYLYLCYLFILLFISVACIQRIDLIRSFGLFSRGRSHGGTAAGRPVRALSLHSVVDVLQ